MENLKLIVLIAVVSAVVSVATGLASPKATPPLGGNGGVVTNFSDFLGQVIIDGWMTQSNTNSTSTTATTQTLSATDIMGYSSVVMTPNVGALTLTFPASSTMSSFVPVAGDWADQCWINATSTAAIDITFAAGTGIDLEVASTTAAGGTVNLTLAPGNSGCFKFIRKPATASAFDIIARYTAGVDGD